MTINRIHIFFLLNCTRELSLEEVTIDTPGHIIELPSQGRLVVNPCVQECQSFSLKEQKKMSLSLNPTIFQACC